MSRLSFVLFPIALATLVAGCAATPPMASPSGAPRVLFAPDTNAPRLQNSDAAGVASVPGYHSVTPETTAPAAATPTPVTPTTPGTPAPVIVVPPR